MVLLAAAAIAPAGARAASGTGLFAAPVTSERIVTDRATGLAIGGHDPVAYFTDGAAVAGRPAHEAVWRGAIWRFVNEGNRAAFLGAPEIYAPAYGGHCALAAAEGRPAAGDPRLFVRHRDRLFFFRSRADRAIWLADPERAIAEADRNWPQIERRLAR